MIGLGAPAQRLAEGGRADGHQHELLEVDGVVGVRAAVQHVQHRHGQRMRVGPADGAVERDLQVVRQGLGAGQRDGEHRVGAEPALVGRAVEVDHGVVDGALVERVEPADDVGDLAVDVATARSTPLPRSGRHRRGAPPLRGCRWRRRRCDGTAPRAGVEQHLGLDGRVARESRTSRPITCSMVLTTSLLGCPPWRDTGAQR